MVSGNQDLGGQCFRGCGLGGISAPQGTFGDVWRVTGCHSCSEGGGMLLASRGWSPEMPRRPPGSGGPTAETPTPGAHQSCIAAAGPFLVMTSPGRPSVPPRGRAGWPTCGLWVGAGWPGPGWAGFVAVVPRGVCGQRLWEAGRLLQRQLAGPRVWGLVLGPPCPWLVRRGHRPLPSRAALGT